MELDAHFESCKSKRGHKHPDLILSAVTADYKAPDSRTYRRLALEDSVHLGVLLCAHHLNEAYRCHEQVPGRKPRSEVNTNTRAGTCGVRDVC